MIAPWILGERIVVGSLGCALQTGEVRFELRCNPPVRFAFASELFTKKRLA